MKHVFTYDAPFGTLLLTEENGCLTGCQRQTSNRNSLFSAKTELQRLVTAELDEYFAASLTKFTVPFSAQGTAFQNLVWQALCAIPFGETCTYGDIAAAIGRPKAARAVGMACNKNPLLLFVPCHRVVGKNGSLVGFAAGLETKEYLLALEKL